MKTSIKILGKTFTASLCAAVLLGVVGVPGALADSRISKGYSSSASSVAGLTYTVKNNDSLSAIASRNKVAFKNLLAVNGFKTTSVILPGQIIKLPDNATTTVELPTNSSVATITAAVSPSAVTSSTYTVIRNDSLSGIASKAKVSLASLLSANGFSKSSVIKPGQIIKLPNNATITVALPTNSSVATITAAVSPSAVTSSTYTVIRNDSLSGIASKAKVSLASLLFANGFSKSSVIKPGQIVKLPTGAVMATLPSNVPTNVAASFSRLQTVLDFAHAQLGKPYAFGTAGPATYDCSGLTRTIFAQIKISLPHQSLMQSKLGKPVDWKAAGIQAGDLVFTFSTKKQTQISHVGIAISSTQWIEAPYSGSAVRIAKLPNGDKIQAVRRVL